MVVRDPDGIRLADRDAYKLWLACRGGDPEGTGGMGMLHKNSVKEVKLGADVHDQHDDGPGEERQIKDRVDVPASRPSVVDEPPAPVQREARLMKVAGLRPNLVNGSVFSTSLTDESIQTLADDIRQRGLRNSVEVRPMVPSSMGSGGGEL